MFFLSTRPIYNSTHTLTLSGYSVSKVALVKEKKNKNYRTHFRFDFSNTGTLNAVRRLKGDNYLQPTGSTRLHLDSIETGSRIEDVTSDEGLEVFRGCERLGS